MQSVWGVALAVVLVAVVGTGKAFADFADHPRMEICLNGEWEWRQEWVGDNGFKKIRVPGAHQWDDQTQEAAVHYRLVFPMPQGLNAEGARWFLRFEKAGWHTRVLLNGTELGENFGTHLPFEFDATDAVKWGADNELRVLLHVADRHHSLPGVELDDLGESLALRSGGRYNRNWVQIAGDVTLEKRPATYVAWRRAETSVRNKTLRVRGELAGVREGKTFKVRATVYDLDTNASVLETTLSVSAGGAFDATVKWDDPVLWGFGPYGEPKLYGLRLALLDGAEVVDIDTSRFGFREVWYEGQKLMLNGRELMIQAASMPHGLDRIPLFEYTYGQYERNQLLRMCQVLRKYGWNGLHNHFDTFGDVIYDVADEIGMLVVAGSHCDGPSWLTPRVRHHPLRDPYLHRVFEGWTKYVGGHPSIALWSHLCVGSTGRGTKHTADEAGAIRKTDTTRPIIGGYGGVEFVKGGLSGIRQEMEEDFKTDDAPRFVQEVFGIDSNEHTADRVKGLLAYMADHRVSGHVTFGHLFPLFDFEVRWPSESGYDTRWSTRLIMDHRSRPAFTGHVNWCDPSQPLHMPSPTGVELGGQYKAQWGDPGDPEPMVYPHVLSEGHGDGARYLAVEAQSPAQPTPRLVLIDPQSTAYVNVRYPGKLRLSEVGMDTMKTKEVHAPKIKLPLQPGYLDLVRVPWAE